MLFFYVWAGPGCSSLGVGAFSENGPFRPSGDALVMNECSWNRGNTIKQMSSMNLFFKILDKCMYAGN